MILQTDSWQKKLELLPHAYFSLNSIGRIFFGGGGSWSVWGESLPPPVDRTLQAYPESINGTAEHVCSNAITVLWPWTRGIRCSVPHSLSMFMYCQDVLQGRLSGSWLLWPHTWERRPQLHYRIAGNFRQG